MNVLHHIWQFQWYRDGLFDWWIISSKRKNVVPWIQSRWSKV